MNINKIAVLGLCLVFGFSSCDKDPVPPSETPQLTISDVTLLELNDGALFTFEVKSPVPATEEITFSFDTQDDTAEAGSDYEATQGTGSIAVGATSATIDVNILSDEVRELDEQFFVKISDLVGGTMADNIGIGTIKNEDTFIDKGVDGYTTPLEYAGYTINWSDEFEAATINTDLWGYDLGDNGWGNQELQNYTNESKNSFIEDGNLIIQAIDEGGEDYSSARMLTKDKKSFKFGRVDVRAKLPEGQGIWPAIWMLGDNIDETSWPACGEIDIMELVGHEPNIVHGTAHWGNVGSPSVFVGRSTIKSEGYQDSYHVFSVVWETSNIDWYVDDELVHTINTNNTTGYNYPFNQPFFMIMNVAVGGQWPGNPNSTTVFPQRMTVDYVRVFDRN